MTLEDIQDAWLEDSKFDRSELGNVSLDIPKLHHKYYKIFSAERLRLRKMETDFKELKRDKWEFYLDGPTEEQLELGWKLPAKGRILKTDIPQYMDSDPEIIEMTLKMSYQLEKVDFCESIIRTISNMNWVVKNAIEWERFKVGA